MNTITASLSFASTSAVDEYNKNEKKKKNHEKTLKIKTFKHKKTHSVGRYVDKRVKAT